MDLTGLNRFRQRLGVLQDNNLLEEITRELVSEGTKHLTSLYNDTSILVTSEVNGNQAYIFAEGEKIAYLEYGTGYIGEKTYDGKLPEIEITFIDAFGIPQRTEGWEYYYDNPRTKRMGGWFYTDDDGELHFTEGDVAQAQMWRTAQWLRENAYNIINQVLARHSI